MALPAATSATCKPSIPECPLSDKSTFPWFPTPIPAYHPKWLATSHTDSKRTTPHTETHAPETSVHFHTYTRTGGIIVPRVLPSAGGIWFGFRPSSACTRSPVQHAASP